MTPNRFPTPCVKYQAGGPTLGYLSKEYPTFYWAHVLEHTLDFTGMGIKPLDGAIMAGAPGNGRHTIAKALSRSLSEKRNIQYFLRAAGSALDDEDVSDVCKALEQAMAEPIRISIPFCFLLDCPEDSRHSLAIQEFLLQKMAYLPKKIFPIIITGSAANIIPELQSSLMICQFERPSKAVREEWFRDALNGARSLQFADQSLNYITLGRDSEGFTWRQMTDLRALLRRTAVIKYFQNEAAFKATGKTAEQLISDKESPIKLTKEEIQSALALIRSQGLPAAIPAAVGAQYVAAMPAGIPVAAAAGVQTVTTVQTAAPAANTASAAPAPTGGLTEEQKEQLKQAQEYHAHPEKMSFVQLADVDDL